MGREAGEWQKFDCPLSSLLMACIISVYIYKCAKIFYIYSIKLHNTRSTINISSKIYLSLISFNYFKINKNPNISLLEISYCLFSKLQTSLRNDS